MYIWFKVYTLLHKCKHELYYPSTRRTAGFMSCVMFLCHILVLCVNDEHLKIRNRIINCNSHEDHTKRSYTSRQLCFSLRDLLTIYRFTYYSEQFTPTSNCIIHSLVFFFVVFLFVGGRTTVKHMMCIYHLRIIGCKCSILYNCLFVALMSAWNTNSVVMYWEWAWDN